MSLFFRKLILQSIIFLNFACYTYVSAANLDDTIKVCATCHGGDGNSTTPNIPKLAGRDPSYLARELNYFSSGKRKSDIMAPVIATVDSSQFKELGLYFGKQNPSSDKITDIKAAANGKKIYLDGDEGKGLPACAGCHEPSGVGSSRFPRLAGQHKEYLVSELNKFKADFHTQESARLMRETAKRMTEEQINDVSEYLSGL